MRSIKGKLSRTILCLFFAVAIVVALVISSNSVNALTVVQHGLVVTDQSSNIVFNGHSINNFSLTPHIEFNRLDDYITYRLTIGNQDGKKYQIVDIVDNNTNDAIDLSYTYPTDLSSGNKEIDFTIKYVKVDTTPLTTVSITIKFIEESGATGQIGLPINYLSYLSVPNTGANTAPGTDFAASENAIIIYGVLALIIVIICARRGGRKGKVVKVGAIAVLGLGLIPFTVIATTTKDLQFSLNFADIQLNGPYTITFDTGTTTAVGAQTVNHGDTVAQPQDPRRDGFIFKGWLDENNQLYVFSQQVTSNHHLTASYVAIIYTIDYDLDGGSVSTPNRATYTAEDLDFTLTNPTKSGHDFLGWTSDNGVTVEPTVTIRQGSTGDKAYTAVWRVTTTPIAYSDNGANSPTTMGNQIVKGTDSTIELWPSNFQRPRNPGDPGYGFAGWNTKADGNGVSYGPNEIIADQATVEDIKANGLSLYAMWVESTGDMQGWRGCSAMNVNDVTALTDTRDGNTYAVAKLADNKCWMMENLRLSNKHIVTGDPVVINSTNTNNPASGFALNDPQEVDSGVWCDDRDAACVDQVLYAAANTRNTIQSMDAKGNFDIYSYGNYYNWYTATAGTGTRVLGPGDATGSICPAGWHLPSGGRNGEYAKLDIALGGNGLQQRGVDVINRWLGFPMNYVTSSRISSYGYYYRGSTGTYWTSTPLETGSGVFGNAYAVYYITGMNSIYVGDNPNSYKSYGDTIRCVINP